MARETLSASPPGSLGRTGDRDLFILVRVRVELINLFLVVPGLGEGVNGVGRGERCVLVGAIGHCGSFRGGWGGGEGGLGSGAGGNREGDVAVRSTDCRRGDPSSFSTDARRHCNLFCNQTRRLKTSFYHERGEYILANMGSKVHLDKTRWKSRQPLILNFTRCRS